MAQTVEVSRGRLAAVTPAFAWDGGEYDRALERRLELHLADGGRESAD